MLKLVLNLVITGLVSTFGTPWRYESTLSTVNFTESKYRSNILDENLAPELRCAVSVEYTLGFQTY